MNLGEGVNLVAIARNADEAGEPGDDEPITPKEHS